MKLHLLISASSFLVTLIILEFFLRSYYWLTSEQFFHFTPKEITITWQNDQLLGRRLTPNQQGWFVSNSGEYFTWITVNKEGWRDLDHTFTKPIDTFRIVIIGDSFVENFQVPLEQTFFRQLQDKLNNQDLFDKKIEMIALGLGDSGTAQQYLILKNYALKYQPDLVIHFFFSGNDVKNNLLMLQGDPHRPYFELKNNQLTLQPFVIKNNLFPQNILTSLKDHSKLLTLILNLKGQIRNQFNVGNDYPIDYHIYDQNYSPDYQTSWELTLQLLLAEEQIVETAGAKFLLVTLANNEQVNKNVWEDLQNIYPKLKAANLDLEKPDKILSEFCQTNNINCLFMLPYFQDFVQKNPAVNTHFRKDGHLTATGTNLMTNFLVEKLLPILEPINN